MQVLVSLVLLLAVLGFVVTFAPAGLAFIASLLPFLVIAAIIGAFLFIGYAILTAVFTIIHVFTSPSGIESDRRYAIKTIALLLSVSGALGAVTFGVTSLLGKS